MASTRVPKASGLWTSPNPLSAPLGSYVQADNCVVDRPDIVTSRRGFSSLGYGPPGSPVQLSSLRGALLAFANGQAYLDSGTAFLSLGVVAGPPTATLKNRVEETGKNAYFTSSTGLYAVDSPSVAAARLAGVPLGPLPTSRHSTTRLANNTGSGWLAADAEVAYVATWQYVDANGTPHEGTPSYPIFVGVPADVTAQSTSLGSAPAPAPAEKLPSSSTVLLSFVTPFQYDAANPPYYVGQRIAVTYASVDARFATGTYTVTVAAPSPSFPYTNWILHFDDGVFNAGGLISNGPVATLSLGGQDVSVGLDIPAEVPAGYHVNVYRSFSVPRAAAPPQPQYYLVQQHVLTAGDKASGFYFFTDSVPEETLSNPLYTNTNDGDPVDSSPDNENSRPPPCADLAQFDQRLWGAQYEEYQTVSLSLLATGAPNGLQVGDTITITGPVTLTWTAVAEGTALTSSTFAVYSSSASIADNIRQTAQSLALAITNYPYATIGGRTFGYDAYATADEQSLFQGDLLIRSKLPASSIVSVDSSRHGAWNPVLPVGSAPTPVASNGLWFSKQNQPESVPLLNRLSVGPANCSILRIKALRDKLYVFTDIAGTFEVSNTYPYQVTELSHTAILVAPNTLVSFNDALYGLTTQGVARFGPTGVQIISIPIEADLKVLYGTGLTQLRQNATAEGYESYRKYILAMPTTTDDRTNTQAFVYDAVTKAWTRWTRPFSALHVVPQTDTLYTASPLTSLVSKERKNYDRSDYADEDFAVTIQSANGTLVTLGTGAAQVQAGDVLFQDTLTQAVVTAVNGNVVTTNASVEWAISTGPLGAATVYPGIQNDVVYTAMFSGAPELAKHYREVCFHFLNSSFDLGYGTFYSDLNPQLVQVPLNNQGGFGERAWQRFAWGQPNGPKNKRALVPTGSQRVAFLNPGFSLRQAWAQWQLLGYTPTYEAGSERETSK